MTTINIERRLLERLYLYWLEDADPRELDEFTAQVRAALSATAPVLTDLHDIKEAVKAVLAAPASAPEPVAWMSPKRFYRTRAMALINGEQLIEPLYLYPPATAPDELERLKAESEERLQNCAALVAEVERLRAAPATAPEQMPLERDCICHQYLHLDAYSGGAAPEGLHGALWVVVEGVRKKYVLADQSSEPKDMPALATTPKQPRPFVPWSKEAEMLESWAAQPATAPEPSWHDAPTVPGLWVSDFSWMAQKLDRDTVEFYAKNRSIPSRRWYGPIPEETRHDQQRIV